MNVEATSSVPPEKLRPEIKQILGMVGLVNKETEILSIATRIEVDGGAAYTDLIEIDKTIPGLGLHNVNEVTPGGRTLGVYNLDDRSIFRGIQYVGEHLSTMPLEWLARTIVTESCYHVESSLKRRVGVTEPLSIGMILHRNKYRTLDGELIEILEHLNKLIYNRAKHTIEDISLDHHMFSIADSIAVYLVCRIIGVRLLKDMGITTKYGTLVF